MRAKKMLVIFIPFYLQVFVSVASGLNRFNYVKTVDEYLNLCLKSSSHKTEPSEENITGACAAWSGKTCCSSSKVGDKTMKELYRFDYNHCNKTMSAKCRRRFIEEWCFFECSPYMGPWMVTVAGWKTRKERTFKMPLCHSTCENWWNDCKDDWTCVRNWNSDFVWSSEGNSCPAHGKCKKISKHYANATDFCESVWDQGWRVAKPESKICFVHEFESGTDNPNKVVATFQAYEILRSLNSALLLQPSVVSLITVACSLLFLRFNA